LVHRFREADLRLVVANNILKSDSYRLRTPDLGRIPTTTNQD
jgi:hypothetical protein